MAPPKLYVERRVAVFYLWAQAPSRCDTCIQCLKFLIDFRKPSLLQ
jgi:hypothetical protein